MIQAQTQQQEYWETDFSLTDSDIEQLYNFFLETEKPQTIEQLTVVLVNHRVDEEIQSLERTAKGRHFYQPQNSYELGDDLVFPALGFVSGTISGVRTGFNPQEGDFQVIAVEIDGKPREFVMAYAKPHPLSAVNDLGLSELLDLDVDSIIAQFSAQVAVTLEKALSEHPDFVKLGSLWFVKSLLAEISVGHLHLSEAVLEINEGGPMSVDEVLPNLDLNSNIAPSVQRFSLNYALLNDDRFDDVGGRDEVAWFLRRMEPEEVQHTPARLVYQPIPYDRTALSPQLLMLVQELDDEWSDIKPSESVDQATFSLTFPHRWSGTLPLSSRLRPLFSSGKAPRQRVTLVDEEANENTIAWVVPEGRYVYGLKDWYEKHEIPVGGFIHLSPTSENGFLKIGYDRRRPKREYVRLATVADNRMRFELKLRSIGSEFDDLLIVGTDAVAAVDALWRRAEANQRSLSSLLAEIFPTLADLTPQKTVHAKTLYSALNMLKRTPPGPIFADLVNNPAFQTVGDHYWMFDQARWQGGK